MEYIQSMKFANFNLKAHFVMGFSDQTKALAQDAGKTITYTNIATP